MSEHAKLIDDLGGGTAVAKELSDLAGRPVDREAVYKWKENGVPWRFRLMLAAMAQKKEIALPSDFLGEPQKAATS